MSNYLHLETRVGRFTVARRNLKAPWPNHRTDAYRCSCPLARRCYARRDERLHPTVRQAATQNQRVVDTLGMEELLTHVALPALRWAVQQGGYYRLAVGGNPTARELRAFARACGQTPGVRVWAPVWAIDPTLADWEASQGRMIVRRSSASADPAPGYAPHRSRVIGDPGELLQALADGVFICPGRCAVCRSPAGLPACWDPMVREVAYRAH